MIYYDKMKREVKKVEYIEKNEDFNKLIYNKVEGEIPVLQNSKITFRGENNILYCEKNVKLVNSTIDFNASNSIIFLSSNKNSYILNVSIYNNSVFYMGKDNYINGRLNIVLSEQKNIMIGNDGLFSFDIWMRVADPHIIYRM